jgi:hypothetical protein
MFSLGKKLALAVAVVATALLIASPATLAAGSYTLFGDAQIVSPGHNSPHAVQLRSDATIPPGYGGIDFQVPSGTTFNDLNNLATDYMFTHNSCGGGSPRFQVNVLDSSTNTVNNIMVYIGPPPNYTGCPQNAWLNTGNLLAPTNLIDTSQLPGGIFYDPVASAKTKFGSYAVTGIQLVADGSWFFPDGVQTAQVDNVMINNSTYTFDQPQDKDECKKGGRQTLTRADGSGFKNQGDCIQYANTGK